MYLSLIDRIVDLDPGKSITAVRCLRPEETYLQDHFPEMPVMPGVLMLESMYQAAAWLVRKSEEFSHSMVLLDDVRNVKYGSFVEPNQELTITANILAQDEQFTTLKASGSVEGRGAVSGRLVLKRFNLAEREPQRESIDHYARHRFRQMFDQLIDPAASMAGGEVSG